MPSDGLAALSPSLPDQALRSPLGGGDYLLGPGDQVDVLVWRNAELSRRVPVRPDGYISLPLVGELTAAGKTAAELEAQITALLGDFVQVPTVTVTVTDIKSLVVYVLGRVGTPGPVTLDRNINVLQAISTAGGLTEFADQNGITILRTIGSQRVRIPYRYGDVMKGRADAGEVVLQSGDVIHVP
ncbi:MAG TPA: polysaccharide biosynthesis/export family protein [Acidobacteriota bacterium]|nr:polysaccharide biosynthesis/export family protein [Acidobacteriota bacterium]